MDNFIALIILFLTQVSRPYFVPLPWSMAHWLFAGGFILLLSMRGKKHRFIIALVMIASGISPYVVYSLEKDFTRAKVFYRGTSFEEHAESCPPPSTLPRDLIVRGAWQLPKEGFIEAAIASDKFNGVYYDRKGSKGEIELVDAVSGSMVSGELSDAIVVSLGDQAPLFADFTEAKSVNRDDRSEVLQIDLLDDGKLKTIFYREPLWDVQFGLLRWRHDSFWADRTLTPKERLRSTVFDTVIKEIERMQACTSNTHGTE